MYLAGVKVGSAVAMKYVGNGLISESASALDDLTNLTNEGQYPLVFILGHLRTEPDHSIMDISPFKSDNLPFAPAGIVANW